MNAEEKYELITRNLQEVVGEKELQDKLEERDIALYLGLAPTGKIHVGYILPLFKIRDFLNAGCKVTILLADIHAYLDNMKSTWEQLEFRTQYYEQVIKALLKGLGADIDQLNFVKGSDYQLQKEFTLDMYKLSALASSHDAQRAGADVVKQTASPKLSGLIYPILQSLDEIYLKADAQFGGVDQRKIFMFAREFLPQVGYSKQIHLMNPMVGGLTGDKMSASDENSKIDITDTPKAVKKKLNKAFCEEGNVEDNFFIDFSRLVLFPWLSDKNETFIIDRPEKFGGTIEYTDFETMKESFAKKELHPLDLKMGVGKYISKILEPVQEELDTDEFKELMKQAYD